MSNYSFLSHPFSFQYLVAAGLRTKSVLVWMCAYTRAIERLFFGAAGERGGTEGCQAYMAGLVCECERVCAPILQEGGEVEGEEGHLFTLFFHRRPSTLHTCLAQECVLVVGDSQLGSLSIFPATLPRIHGILPSISF